MAIKNYDRLRLALYVFGLLSISVCGSAVAQTEDGSTPELSKALATKQAMIRERLGRFEDRVFRLREQIAELEPENANRLGRVLERSAELGLADKLEDIVALLENKSGLTEANDAQAKWVADADRLLAILMERDSDNEERREEISRLRDYHAEVQKLLKEERALREESKRSTNTKRLGAQLGQAIERIDALLERQGKLSQESKAQSGRKDSPKVRKDASQSQSKLGKDTESLGADVKKIAESKSADSSKGDPSDEARKQAGEAAQALDQSSNAMADASKKLQDNDDKATDKAQHEAEEKLKEARKKLQDAKDKLDAQSQAKDQGEKQRSTAEDTRELSEEMKKGGSPGESSKGQEGGKQGGKEGGEQGEQQGQQGQQSSESDSPAPGSKNVEKAEKAMKDAAEELDDKSPEKAGKHQDKAIKELEQAQKELEEAIEQLRKEEKAETLRDLEERFRKMLSLQRVINDETLALYDVGNDHFQRSHRLQLADLSTRQRTLSNDASTCLHILEEEGSTIVFPSVLEQVSEDMATVADRLAALRVGMLTQTVEQQIVDALEQILESVKQMQQENEQNDSAGTQGSSQEPPLLPFSAELKLLRSSQVRVNQRTIAIAHALEDRVSLSESFDDMMAGTAKRQVECARLAKKMRDREMGE